jgi:3-methylcrotonyl-CoA carboxylase alpha subunit
VIAVLVEQGETVEQGTPLIVMEAMKMEQTLAAAADGVIASVNVAPGDQVEAGAALVVFETAKDEA